LVRTLLKVVEGREMFTQEGQRPSPSIRRERCPPIEGMLRKKTAFTMGRNAADGWGNKKARRERRGG